MANNSTINKILNNKTKKEKETVKAVADSITKQRGGTTTSTTTTSDNSATKSAIASLLKNTNTTAEKAASAVNNVTNQSKLKTPTDLKDTTVKTSSQVEYTANSNTKTASKTSPTTTSTTSSTTKDNTKTTTSTASSSSSSSTKDAVKSSISDKKSSTKNSSAKSTEKKITGIDILLGNAAKTSGNAKTASSAKTVKRNDIVDKLLNTANSVSKKSSVTKSDVKAGYTSSGRNLSAWKDNVKKAGKTSGGNSLGAGIISKNAGGIYAAANKAGGNATGAIKELTKHINNGAYMNEAKGMTDSVLSGIQSNIIRNAKELPRLQYRPQDYQEKQDEYNALVYDQYFGEGAYRKILENGTKEEKAKLAEDLNDIWGDIVNGNVEKAYKTATEQGIYTPRAQGYKTEGNNLGLTEAYYYLIRGKKEGEPEGNLFDQYKGTKENEREAFAKEALKLSNAKKYLSTGWNDVWEKLADERDEATEKKNAALERIENPGVIEDSLLSELDSNIIKEAKILPKLRYRPEDYQEKKEYYDALVYDQYFGEGEYNRIRTSGTTEEKYKLADDLNDIWGDIVNGKVERIYKQVNELPESELRYANEQLEGIRRKEEQQANYMDLMWKYSDNEQDPDYVPEYDKGGFTYGMNEIERGVQTSDISRVYSFLGKGKEYEEWAKWSETNGDANVTNEYNYAMMMTDGSGDSYDEIGTFMKLYNQAAEEGREPEEAKAFYDALMPYLRQRYEQYEAIQVTEAAEKMPVLTSIASLGMDLANMPMDIIRHAGHALGDKNTEDRGSGYYAGARQSELIEEAVAEKIGGIGGKFYKNLKNTAGNVIRAYAFPSTSKAAQLVMGLGSFFLQVDQEATARYLKDYDYETAQKLGYLDALGEVAEEFLPYDTMLEFADKGIFTRLLVNGLSELGQEATGATVGEKIKGVITGKDSEQQRADEIFNKGYFIGPNGKKVKLNEDKNLAMQQAKAQAKIEFWKNAIESGAAGFFGGSMGAAYHTTAQAATEARMESNYNKALGNKALNSGTESITNNKANAAEIRGVQYDNIRTMIEAAAKMGEDTDSYRIGKQLEEAVRSGEKVKPQMVGKLVRTLMGETSGEIKKTVKDMLGNTLEQRLAEMGEKGDAVKIKGKALANLIAGQGSMEDLWIMARDEQEGSGAMGKLLKEYQMSGMDEKIREEINEKIKEPASIQETLTAMVGNPKVSTETIKKMVGNAEVASAKEIRDAEGESTGSALEVITEGKIKEIASVQMIKKEEISEEGKKVEVKRLQINFTDGTSTDVANTKAAALGAAQVLQFAQMNGNQTNSDEITNILLKNVNKTNDATNMIAGAQRILWDVATGIKTGRSGLTPNLESQIREAAENSYEKWNNERRNSYRKINPGNGIVTYNGALYGTEDFTKALAQDKRLSNRQKTEAMMVGKIAKAMGFDVALTYDDKNTWNQGHYASDEGIVINLAGNYVDGIKRSALATLPHEITHWLEANSPVMALQLRKFVLTAQAKQGLDVQKRLQGTMDSYKSHGVDIDIFGAISEMVAKSCEEVLTNENMIRKMREENPELYGKVYNAVMSVVDRVKDALKMAKVTSSVYAKNLEIYGDRLADVWQRTYEEAKNATGTRADGAAKSQASVQETDAEYMQAVNRGDMETAQRIVDEAADRAGYTIKAYHGTAAPFNVFDRKKLGSATAAATATVGFFLTDERNVSEKFSNISRDIFKQALGIPDKTATVMDLRIKLNNPYIYKNDEHDAFEDFREDLFESAKEYTENWAYPIKTKLDFKEMPQLRKKEVGDYFARRLKEKGYDGIIIKKTTMDGKKPHDFYIAFDSEQVKRADAVTYDDDGKVIQPSERFKTEKKDIRYSVQESDAEYMQAVENGDMETTQRMVDQAAETAMPNSKVRDKTGKLLKVYHGTKADFNEFRRDYIGSTGRFEGSGFNFTPYEGRAKSYGGNVLAGYLNIQNPLSAEEKTISVAKLARIIREADPTGDNIISDYARETRDYGSDSFVRRESMTAARNIWEASENDVDIYSFISAADSDAEGLISKFAELGYDGLIHYNDDGSIKTAVAFSSEQFKKADPVTYDDNGDIIPLSERFNEGKTDIRYSIADDEGNTLAAEVAPGTVAKYSLQSWMEDDWYKIYNSLRRAGYEAEDIRKWMTDVNSVAAIIAADKDRLDYKADRDQKYLKKNADVYKYTLDASTLCAKRLLYQGTFNAIQAMLPNTPLKPGDLIDLANMMHEMGYQTPCGICYVESKRRHTGNAAEQFLQKYKGEYTPKIAELTSTEGLAKLKQEHPQAYKDFIKAMNARGSGSVKLVQMRTDYRRDVRRMSKNMVEYLNSVGGLRIQSFSDFETPHLIDMMQALLDMTAKGLKSQAYTKVPNFAWVFGDTGIKINLSLMGEGTGLDSKGRLKFSDTEGMKFKDAMALRDRYSENVGTILVGMNDAHIIAAMGDNRIDFIIPFHKSGWSTEELSKMKTLEHYEDYQDYQNERKITGRENGKYITVKTENGNIDPVSYWDYSKTGTENAQRYLEICAEKGLQPKFYNFLVDNGDGTYSLPTDNSERSRNIRNGYWKTLIDFKMYDNDGIGAPQRTVTPNVNMEEAERVLAEYEGGANTLPVAQPVVERYVREYKEKHRDKTQFSIMDDNEGNIYYWMRSVKPETLQTAAEKELLEHFKAVDMRIDLRRARIMELKDKIAKLEAMGDKLDRDGKRRIQKWKVEMANAQQVKEAAEAELAEIISSEGYGKMMKNQQRIFNDFMYGKTSAEVSEEVKRLQEAGESIARMIEENQKTVDALAKTDAMKQVKEILESTTANEAVAYLKKKYNSTWTKPQLRAYMDPILALAAKQDLESDEFMAKVREMAEVLVESDASKTYETLDALRGLTITIGKGAQKELRATHRSINTIRDALIGTGIKVRFGETSNLDTDTGEGGSLRTQFPDMPEITSDLNAIDEFIRWVNGMRGQENMEFYEQSVQDAEAEVLAQAVGVAARGKIYVPADAKARQQITDLIEYVKELKTKTDAAEKTLTQIREQIGELTRAGGQAAVKANVLTQHIGEALEYYDKTAKIAVDKAKQERNNTIVDQLKSKHAQDIAKRNEEWRNLIERDKQARKTAEDIQRGRNMINTALKRTLNMLKNPKGTKNIPEYMQGLARELLTYFVDNDLNELRRQKITLADKAQLEETKRLLNAWEEQDGPFNMADLNAAQNEDVVPIFVENDLMTIADCLEQLNGNIRGKNRLDTLNKRAEVMKQLQEAVGEIYSIIRKEGEIQVRDRQVDTSEQAWKILQNTNGKRYREWTGKPGNIIRLLNKAIVQGNMTPEYFFRMLANEGLSELWENYHAAENRNGLELKKAQERLAEIAEKHGYKNWDTKQKVKLNLDSGDVEITLGQLMSLWATWKRENTLGPAMSEHLTKGGFHAEVDLRDGKFGRTEVERKAHRVTENDMKRVEALLTDEQLAFIDDVVSFMSNEMSELGNEASMAAYGIRMYKGKYYFPFQMWDGVKNQKSNDSGSAAGAQDRAFHPSFSKTRMHGANNAIILGDFLQTATDHIVGMINYATMGLANENMQKVLNYKMTEGNSTLDQTTRNVKTILEDAYGQQAMQYLQELKTQLNGGAVKVEKTFYDKLISLFRKNAVAGSLSVALQQPLSYIRAATMINPKYLARALSPDMWKGSYKEMLEHSGVAVIKDMGRFDMNFGQGAREFLMPDGYQKTMPKIWGTITEKATILPELMDRMTWTRMWSACKVEIKALHPEMDVRSDEFLDMVGERFNDLMRRTQVYDSVLVKSANMRNQNPGIKMLTSFMAEPTLTANVLADSVRAAVKGEKGGKALMAKAGATFLFSAVMQAAVKGAFGAGRNPDDKKNWWENFLYRFFSNLIGEADPLTLIPGYSTAIDLMKGSDISDNALGAAGKLFDAAKTGIDALLGNKSRGAWRDVEDSVGQIVQLFTNLPAKNLMRDARAMYNWVTGAMEETSPYAWRGTDWNVVKNQTKDLFYNADNLIGVVNQYMGEAGYQTSNAAYYKRIYEAQKAGNEAEAQSMIDYLIKGKGLKEKTISDKLIAEAKADESMSAEETAEFMTQNGGNAEDYIRDQLREGNMTPEEARKQLKKTNPEKDDNAIWWQVDRIEYQLETGAEKAPGGNSYYYRLSDAVDNNSVTEIRSAVNDLMAHGVDRKNILEKTSDWKSAYLQADNAGKVKIRNAIQQVYIAAGSTAAEADKKINKWK